MLTFCSAGLCRVGWNLERVQKLLRGLLALAAVWGLVIFLCRCWLVLSLPYQLEYGEGHMLGLAYWLKQGRSIYAPGPNPPWAFGFHFPLYLWLVSRCMGDIPSFFAGRLISITASLVALTASAAWLKAKAGNQAALAGLAFLLLHPLLLGWAPLERVDTLALAFSVLAILSARRPAVAAPLCLLSLFCKQSFVAAPLAVALSLQRKQGLLFLAVYGLASLALLLILGNTVFPGLLTLHSKLSSDPASAMTLWVTCAPTLLLLAALAYLAPRDLQGSQVWRYYAFTSLIPAAAALKQGSYYYYFLELHWALSILAASALAQPDRLRCGLTVIQLLLGSCCRFPILESPLNHWRHETWAWLRGDQPAWRKRMQAYDQLGEVLARYPGPVLAEQCGNPLLFGREPLVCDCFALFYDQARAGFQVKPLLEMIRQRRIGVILLQRLDESNLRVPIEVIQLILQHYQITGKVGSDFVLTPRVEPVKP